MYKHGFAGLMGVGVMVAAVACGGGSPSAPSSVPTGSTTTPSGGGTGTGTVTVAYTQDIKPILDADCVRCHSSSNRSGGVDLSSYATVMRVVSAGSSSSTLVRMTQSGGAMYSYLSGDRASKSALIRSWVVDNGAAQSR
jgi:hypothetical protein